MNQPNLINEKLLPYFHNVISIVFAIMLLFLAIGILIGTAKLFLSLGALFSSGKITGSYHQIISDVLSLFIVIELSRSLVDYFEVHRLRMTFIIDAGIVFVLREILIKLFEHKIMPEDIYALSSLLLVLGILRFASVVLYQGEQATIVVARDKQERQE